MTHKHEKFRIAEYEVARWGRYARNWERATRVLFVAAVTVFALSFLTDDGALALSIATLGLIGLSWYSHHKRNEMYREANKAQEALARAALDFDYE